MPSELAVQEIEEIKQGGNTLILKAKNHLVINQETADEANLILTSLNNGLKKIEEKRKSFTAPLNQSLKEINNTFKAITEPIEECKQELSSRLMSWRFQEQARIRAEQEKAEKEEERRRKIQEAHAAKGHKVNEEITPVAKPVPFAINDTTKTRTVWTHEITDESLIPRTYLIVNSAAITKAVREGVRDIPGIKIFQKEIPIY